MRERLTDHPERIKTAAAGKRQIPDDYKYNPKKIKHLKHILHNVSVALGTLTSALNEFSRLKGPEISPDGLLGGVGYIIPIQDIKQALISSIHSLGNVADSIADELTNPKWNIQDDKEVKKLIEEKEDVLEKVEEEINPDDVMTAKEELIDQDINKEASIKKANVLTAAVKKELMSFFRK